MSHHDASGRDLGPLLVANRGEIAARVLRTARGLGYGTVAVYSTADTGAPWLALADQAIEIGPPAAEQSYLSIDRILEAARSSGAGAVHPGYGFLSENADFARACAEAGLIFVGPPADSIALMGDKAAAKRLMIESGVPCVPGFHQTGAGDDDLRDAARQLGFPIMVKAAAGGGGRGMRRVAREEDLGAAITRARSEAKKAFGSEELILERAIQRPRHVEVQVFADEHGHVIHLGERDCSLQRRHQKVIEESPCPVMTPGLRRRMGEAAVEAARAVGYVGAGTVEFLLEGEEPGDDADFYFLEMNTRLQVEHPVTELVTGLDLVALQLRVAEGRPLGVAQDDVCLDGHAIEARLYAEDPAHDFLPAPGRVALWRAPRGEGLRIDAGVATGFDISPHYDPLVAKLIAWGPDRETARRRLARGLRQTVLLGPENNRGFLLTCLEHDSFVAGRTTTAFIDEELGDESLRRPPPSSAQIAAGAVLQYRASRLGHHRRSVLVSPGLLDWSSSAVLGAHYAYSIGAGPNAARWQVAVAPRGPDAADAYAVRLVGPAAAAGAEAEPDGASRDLEVRLLEDDGVECTLEIDGRRARAARQGRDATCLQIGFDDLTVELENELAVRGSSREAGGGGRVVAPMHGSVVEISVEVGQRVSSGERVAVIEAMKMQHELTSEVDGEVVAVAQQAGAQVAAGDLLVEIEPAEASS